MANSSSGNTSAGGNPTVRMTRNAGGKRYGESLKRSEAEQLGLDQSSYELVEKDRAMRSGDVTKR